jgi:hypothetical protein
MKAFDLFEYQSIMMKGNWTWTGYRQRVRLNELEMPTSFKMGRGLWKNNNRHTYMFIQSKLPYAGGLLFHFQKENRFP